MEIHSSALPFSGLGFDLAPAHQRARLMNWLRLPLLLPLQGARRPPSVAPSAHGYDLLVYLSREIRGS